MVEILGPAADAFRQRGAALMAIYHDAPESVPLHELRSDAAIVVPPELPMPEGLVEQRMTAGRFACALHVGPYEQLPDAWAGLMGEWLPASGHRVGEGPSYELYLNDPTTTPKAVLRTEMYLPLA